MGIAFLRQPLSCALWSGAPGRRPVKLFATLSSDAQSRDLAFEVARIAEVFIPALPLHIEEIQLSRRARPPANQSAVGKNPGADSGAEGDEHEVTCVVRRAAPVLADGGHVGVVFQRHRHVERFLQGAAKVDVGPPRQIVGKRDEACSGVNGAGNSDTQSLQLGSVCLCPAASAGAPRRRDYLADIFFDLRDHLARTILRPDLDI